MNKTINRINELVSSLGLSARQFDLSIGAANGYTLRMQKNNASVGSDVIERIIKEYPQVNLIWLITGKGDMFVSFQKKENLKSKEEIEKYIDTKINERLAEEKKELLDDILNEISKTKKNTNL